MMVTITVQWNTSKGWNQAHATNLMQQTSRNQPHATNLMQPTSCNRPHATNLMQPISCNQPRVTYVGMECLRRNDGSNKDRLRKFDGHH